MLFRFTTVLISIFLIFSCQNQSEVRKLEISEVNSNAYKNLLCFDLSDDVEVVGSLVLNNRQYQIGRNTLILPFVVKKYNQNLEVLSSIQSYRGYTIVDYNSSTESTLSHIDFSPQYISEKDDDNDLSILWSKSGLKRKFIYKHSVPKLTSITRLDTLKYVGIILPKKSKIFEGRDDKSDLIDTDIKLETARLYSVDSLSARNSTQLKVDYYVEASEDQQEVMSFFLKLLALIFIPTFQFIFYDREVDDKRKSIKKIFIWISIGIQVLVASYLGYLYYTEFVSGSNPSIFEPILVVLGLLLEAFVIWMKFGAKAK